LVVIFFASFSGMSLELPARALAISMKNSARSVGVVQRPAAAISG
jgi:hypothetical protein